MLGVFAMSKAIAVSDVAYEKLAQAAQSRGVSIEQLLDDLSQRLPPRSQTAVIEVLSRGGLAPLSTDAFADLIDSTTDYNDIRRVLAQKSMTLSETILAERD
jgi:hypothetical protein